MLDSEKLNAASRTFKAVFLQSLRLDDGPWRMLVEEERAMGKQVTKHWLSGSGKVREWLGPRKSDEARVYEHTLKNKKWSNTIKVLVEDIEDDTLGLYQGAISQSAKNFDLHRNKLLFQTLMLDAFSGLAYDGQAFCDTDHQDADETPQSNKGTEAFSTSAFDKAIERMSQLTDPEGDYLGIYPTHLFAPPQLRAEVKKVIGNPHILAEGAAANGAAAIENYNVGEVTPVILPWLAGQPNYWFLADLSKDEKPFRYQVRKDVEWRAMDRPDSDHVFDNDEVRYGGRARYNIGYGFWQYFYGSDGTS